VLEFIEEFYTGACIGKTLML